MKSINRTLTIGAFTLAAAALAMGNSLTPSNEPAYNPATGVAISGVVTGVRRVPAGSPLAGVHVTAKTKTATYDVYLGPADFLRMLKTDIETGDAIDVIGSQVTIANQNVILTREVTDGPTTIELRDLYGHPNWTGGVEAATSTGD